MRNKKNITKKAQFEDKIENYQKRMTWVVSPEDLKEEELIRALRKKLKISKKFDINDKYIIQSARKVQNWEKNSGNVAYVRFIYKFADNVVQKGYILAIDGKQFMPGTALIELKDGKKDIIIDPIASVSQIFKVRNIAEEGEWYHAVRKLIITMADLWELDKLIDGELLLVSEGPICRSCKNIINTLGLEYPNINITSIREKIPK